MNYSTIQSPDEIPERFVTGWNNRDADELVSIFTNDAEFINVVGLWWHNKNDIREAHDYGLKVIFSESDLKLVNFTTKYLTDDIALVHARMRLANQTAHGDVSVPQLRHNIFTFVVQKFEAGWLCVSAHNTDIVPGAETNIVSDDGNLKHVNYRK